MLDCRRVFELTKWLDDLLQQEPLRFSDMQPGDIPQTGGVYLVSDFGHGREEIVYVGLTGKLRQRVWSNQYRGNEKSAPVKVALVHLGRATDMTSAKEYMHEHSAVRFDVVPDYREREMREGFAKAVLNPEFALYKSKEH